MHICTIRSKIVQQNITDEVGYFVSEVDVSMVEASATGDPSGFVQHKIAEALAVAVLLTNLPLKEGLWLIEFSKFAQNNFNYPEGIVA
jgi:hypothetical protein